MERLAVNIRKARPADIDGITTIYEQAVLLGTGSFEIVPPGADVMLMRMKEAEQAKCPYLVAELEGAIMGFAYCHPYRPRPAYRYTIEDSVYVHPECRNLGVGTQLLTSLISECDLRGFKEMIAVIGDSENTASIKLHEHCGFIRVGVLRSVGYKFDRWLDSVLMQRSLGNGTTMTC